MFQFSSNFFSVVCLGNFNPAILSIWFIKEKCGYAFDGNPREQVTPVVSKVEDNEISIITEFPKFQIVREQYDKSKALEVVKLAITYLTVLEYTPIDALGINFNYYVSSFIQERIDLNFYNHVRDVGLSLCKEEEIMSTMSYGDSNLVKLRRSQLRIRPLEQVTCTVDINNPDGNMKLNVNFEVNELRNDRSKVELIIANFDRIFKLRDDIIESVFKKYE